MFYAVSCNLTRIGFRSKYIGFVWYVKRYFGLEPDYCTNGSNPYGWFFRWGSKG